MALEILLNHEDIDLVITDVMMPEMDGIELVQQIRKQEPTQKLPIIVISAYIGVNATHEVLEKGASAFMVKPIEAQALKQYITRYLPQAS
jgi:CheY-like chemotaxis protein